jgi:diguanylate cyclase (GGDEF)-like protein
MSAPTSTRARPTTLLMLQCDVLEAIASGQSLACVAALLCRRVEALAPTAVCSVLTVDDAGQLLSVASPSLPDAYSRALDGTPIGPDVGPCGTAAFLGHPVEIHDIDSDPRWALYKALPLAAGLRACWSSPVKSADGRVVGIFSIYSHHRRAPNSRERRVVETSLHLCSLAMERDITQQRLSQTNHRFDVALSNMSQGLCFFDGARNLIVANRRYAEIYDLPPEQITPGMSLEAIVALRVAAGSGPTMAADSYLDWRLELKASDSPTDTVSELANGRTIAIHRHPMPDSGSVATHEDITERTLAEAKIRQMAHHDELTGLPNRVVFQQHVKQALAISGRNTKCSVLYLDLDHFKTVNDTFGHSAGDALLRAVAGRLAACVRKGDIVTRLSGDEFAILLIGLDTPERAGELARRIGRVVSQPYTLDGLSIETSASIGISIAPRDGDTPDKLMKSADTALYRAKQDERGSQRYFEPDMDARLQARFALERDLRQAVANNEFELAYQPIYALATNTICAFEALLRWHHPTRGSVSPAEFIPVAEETGLIVPIGAWVLRHACKEAARWPASVKVAVNLSLAQFKNTGLVETLTQALSAAGLPASRLELEITESLLLKNTSDTLGALHKMRNMGASIAMDDFGTGYSSLSSLRSFPFDKIKIDQSFVRDISDKRDSIAIIRAIVGLAKNLGMVTTAEGVETPDQLSCVIAEGCTQVQGYVFSRPLSAKDAREWIEAERTSGSRRFAAVVGGSQLVDRDPGLGAH